jgi:hypothetical protein
MEVSVASSPWRRRSRVALVLAALIGLPAAALAQPPASNPDEMCGDGTTFRVDLPGRPGSLPDGLVAAPDYVVLPSGCDIYAVFVSGYSVNPLLDLLSFYKLAKFVAERNGYVHYSWWNNFMGEYLRGPLHGPPGTVLTPGRLPHHVLGFVPLDIVAGPDKAVPDEDHQFQDDARIVLAAIRARHPHALIIVAGHSMGGSAVARLGAATPTRIDLLAPIDPVGNRSTPVGIPGTFFYNWNRWRVANNLLGYRQVDCVRDGLVCRDYDPRLLYFSFRCQAVGPVLSQPPLLPTLAPIACPRGPANPYRVMGSAPHVGANVRMLYHRWQQEFPFPFDVGANYVLSRGSLTPLLGGNYQQPLLENALFERNRDKSCGDFGVLSRTAVIAQLLLPNFILPITLVPPQPNAPRDPDVPCSPFDGHGEIVGFGTSHLYGVQAQGEWPCHPDVVDPHSDCGPDDPAERRRLLVEMATADPPHPDKTIHRSDLQAWDHEPRNPHLDLVVDDMITIVQHLLDQHPADGDDVAPSTAAATLPGANAAGWHSEDVQLSLAATDAGSGVLEIEHTTTGAQPGGPIVTPGASAVIMIGTEGLTTVRYFARDNEGNVEAPQELVVRLDKTAPEVSAETSAAPNAAGWFNVPVTVTFPASDALSGLASSSPDVTVATEGADQEVSGTAEDAAGNQASAAATVSIDLTAPDIVVTGPSDGAVVLLNGAVTAGYECRDVLSGIASCEGTLPDGAAIDTSTPGDRTFSVTARDVAGNSATRAHAYAVRYGFSGFLQLPILIDKDPVDPRAGNVVPVLWALRDASGTPLSDLRTFVSLGSAPAACDGSGVGAAEAAVAYNDAPLFYHGGDRQFAFKWLTDASWAGTCRQLQLRLADGATHTSVIRFR